MPRTSPCAATCATGHASWSTWTLRWSTRLSSTPPAAPWNVTLRLVPSLSSAACAGKTTKSSGYVNASVGTISRSCEGLCHRNRRCAPPVFWNISMRNEYSSPAWSWTGAEFCSTSQSSTQWSMTRRSSIHSRKPLSPIAENVYASLKSGVILPVQRAEVRSPRPVSSANVGTRLGNSIRWSGIVALRSVSGQPGPPDRKYSPLRPLSSARSWAATSVAPASSVVVAAGVAVAPTAVATARGTVSAAASAATTILAGLPRGGATAVMDCIRASSSSSESKDCSDAAAYRAPVSGGRPPWRTATSPQNQTTSTRKRQQVTARDIAWQRPRTRETPNPGSFLT